MANYTPYKLKVVYPPEAQFEIELDNHPKLIGRSTDSHIRLDDEWISRRHSLIWIEENRVLLEDLNSTNGTWISAQPIHSPTPVDINQEIQLGPFILKIEPLLNLSFQVQQEQSMLQHWCAFLAPKPIFEQQIQEYFKEGSEMGFGCALITVQIKNLESIFEHAGDDGCAFILQEIYNILDKERISDELLGCFRPKSFDLALRDIENQMAQQFSLSIQNQIQNQKFRFNDHPILVEVRVECRFNPAPQPHTTNES